MAVFKSTIPLREHPHNIRMVIENIKRGGDDLLFSSQNLQDCSDCAKNRAPHRSWVVIDVKILFWSKSPSELEDIDGLS